MNSPTTPARKRLPRFKPVPEASAPFRLTDRDLEIVSTVHEYRYVTNDHIRALIPGSPQQLTRRLRGLFDHHYLERLKPQTARLQRLPDPTYYLALGPKGAELLRSVLPQENIYWRPKHNLRTEDFVEHEAMVADFRITLQLAAGQTPDVQLLAWAPEDTVSTTFHVAHGNTAVPYQVRPDGYAALSIGPQHWNLFFEADRGNVDHRRIARKLRAYWHYFSDGSPYWTTYHEPKRRLVLFATTTEARLRNLLETTAALDDRARGLMQFWYCLDTDYTLDDPRSILGPIWRTVWNLKQGHDADRKSLLS